jgi:putative N6-adenine-specific DNA methylase
MKLELIATATFGLEALVKREVESLGYKIIKSEDGKITFLGDERAICRSNLWLRCADRVLLKMAEFEAKTFEELYQQTKGIPWENLIPPDGKFPVNGSSVKSTLHSVPACQSIVKKAVADRLTEAYGTKTLGETGDEYEIKVTLLKDRATLTVDTTGPGLHKRGYRVKDVRAPIKETLAAALVQLSFWREGRLLVDPCCGSGTIPIEAALIGMNIAPGLSRSFTSENWNLIDVSVWKDERKKAFDEIKYDADLKIIGSDVDPTAISAARQNALEAGVSDAIEFHIADVAALASDEPRGVIITNPPYGERIGEQKDIEKIYGALQRFLKQHPDWSLFLVTTDKNVEQIVAGRPADRRRKLYNGRLEVCYYQFHGEKP